MAYERGGDRMTGRASAQLAAAQHIQFLGPQIRKPYVSQEPQFEQQSVLTVLEIRNVFQFSV